MCTFCSLPNRHLLSTIPPSRSLTSSAALYFTHESLPFSSFPSPFWTSRIPDSEKKREKLDGHGKRGNCLAYNACKKSINPPATPAASCSCCASLSFFFCASKLANPAGCFFGRLLRFVEGGGACGGFRFVVSVLLELAVAIIVSVVVVVVVVVAPSLVGSLARVRGAVVVAGNGREEDDDDVLAERGTTSSRRCCDVVVVVEGSVLFFFARGGKLASREVERSGGGAVVSLEVGSRLRMSAPMSATEDVVDSLVDRGRDGGGGGGGRESVSSSLRALAVLVVVRYAVGCRTSFVGEGQGGVVLIRFLTRSNCFLPWSLVVVLGWWRLTEMRRQAPHEPTNSPPSIQYAAPAIPPMVSAPQ